MKAISYAWLARALVAAALGWALATPAWAVPGVCRVNGNGAPGGGNTVDLTTLSPLPLDWPIGQSMNTADFTTTIGWSVTNCTFLKANGDAMRLMTTIRSNLPVAQTPYGPAIDISSISPGMVGVGIVMEVTETRTGQHANLSGMGNVSGSQPLFDLPPSTSDTFINLVLRMRYVKLRQLPFKTCGSVTTALACLGQPVAGLVQFSLMRISDGSTYIFSPFTPFANVTSLPDVLQAEGTCNIAAGTNNTIALGPVQASALTTVGTVVDVPSGNFALTFNCPFVSHNPSVGSQTWISFTDNYSPSNNTSDLSINPAFSVARGVVLRLVNTDVGTDVIFGQDCMSAGAYANGCADIDASKLIPLGTSQVMVSNYKVQYKRTADALVSGSLNAVATYTLVYR